MKCSLAFALIALAAISQAQTDTQDNALIVLKFSCGTHKTGSGMIRSVQDPDPPNNGPIRINQTVRNEPQEVKNQRDMMERRAELATAEINATLSTQRAPKIYFYRLRVKNASTKVVSSFAWQYQNFNQPDISDRQFFCHIKAKPNENKDLELFSPLAPSHVIDASKAQDDSAKDPDAKVLINKVEYTDGTFWQRKGWNPKIFPDDAIQKISEGKCIGL